LLRRGLDVEPYARNAWNSVKQQVLGAVAYPGILFGKGEGSTNSVEDRGQR